MEVVTLLERGYDTATQPVSALEANEILEGIISRDQWGWSYDDLQQLNSNWIRPGPLGYRTTLFFIGDELVIKTSPHLKPHEAAVQHYLAEHNLALPVLYFGPVTDLPEEVQVTLFGNRRSHSYFLLMPQAEHITDNIDLLSPEEAEVIDAFMLYVRRFLWDHLHIGDWEARARHVKRYQGELVAIDLETEIAYEFENCRWEEL